MRCPVWTHPAKQDDRPPLWMALSGLALLAACIVPLLFGQEWGLWVWGAASVAVVGIHALVYIVRLICRGMDR